MNNFTELNVGKCGWTTNPSTMWKFSWMKWVLKAQSTRKNDVEEILAHCDTMDGLMATAQLTRIQTQLNAIHGVY